jgi:hypothetical protein
MGLGRKKGPGGGGGVGAVLTVTAPAGVTVSVSKDGKTKTKTANADGLAVFKGLATGTWTLTITDGVQTSTKPVVITADYDTVIAFFSATVNITYPSGSTCTCSDGSTTLTAPDTSGTWACVVPNTGTWTVSCTNGTESKSETVTITADGQSVAVELAFWNGELFVNGDQFTSITGGWDGSGWVNGWGNAAVNGPSSITSAEITLTNNGREDILFGVFSGNKIDLSKYTKLVVTVGSSNASNFQLIVNDIKKASSDFGEVPVVAYTYLTKGTRTLDISKIDSGYIAAYFWSTGGTYTAKITDMHLE